MTTDQIAGEKVTLLCTSIPQSAGRMLLPNEVGGACVDFVKFVDE